MRNALLYIAPAIGLLILSLGSAVTATPVASTAYGLDEIEWIRMKADLNGDRVLSRDEVWEEDASLAARFDDVDLDRDGMLNAGEFELLLISS